jgi:hypothetical protein
MPIANAHPFFTVRDRYLSRTEHRCKEHLSYLRKEKKATCLPNYLPFFAIFEIFRSDFRKYFYGVFELLMQRNCQENAIKKIEGKKRQENKSQLFWRF